MRRSWATGILWVGALLGYANTARADDKDPKQACVDAAEQGQSLRDEGKYRAARASFLVCARDVCPKVVEQSCTKWLREVDESAPTIVLGARDDQGNDITNVKVTFDGQLFTTVLDGKPVAADVGEHTVRFEREGSVPVEQKLLLSAGDRARLVRVTLQAIAPETPPPPVPPPPVPTPAPEEPPEAVLSAHHVTAGALAAGAVVAAGTGVAFLLLSSSAKSSAADLRGGLPSTSSCLGVTSATCSSLGDKVDSQHRDMNVATGLFAGAGVLAIGAVGAWFLWPHAQPEQTQTRAQTQTTGWIAPIRGGASLQVGGSFQ